MPNEITIYGIVGEDVSANDVKSQIATLASNEPLIVRINSEGGSVADGLTIYDELCSYAGHKTAIIESMAFSAASHIAMACDEIEITENGYMMIHNPHMPVDGDDAEHASAAELLSKLKLSMVTAYCRKSGKSVEDVLAIMQKTTWLNAEEAIAAGFVNRVTTAKPLSMRAAARVLSMPPRVLASLFGVASEAGEPCDKTKGTPMSEPQKPVAASLGEIKAAFPKAKAEFILSCLEKSLPMASVMSEALAAMEEENQQLKAQLAEALAASKAKAEEPPMETEVEIEEEKPMESKAAAKLRGVKPVAVATNVRKMSAKAEWNEKITAKVREGVPRDKAAAIVNRENPGLRQQMIDEANAA